MKQPPKITQLARTIKSGQCGLVHSADGIVGCCVAGDSKGAKCILEPPRVDSRCRVRRLTPKEYGALQGFPMNRWKQMVSNTQAYKQFGNAVTVTVAKAIAVSIADFLENASTVKEEKSS